MKLSSPTQEILIISRKIHNRRDYTSYELSKENIDFA